MMQDAHSAYPAGGIDQPTQVATRTLGSEGDPDSAAYRGVECKASIAVDESRLGSSRRRLMDSVVAPYLRVLDLEPLVGMNVECTLGMSLIEPTKG